MTEAERCFGDLQRSLFQWKCVMRPSEGTVWTPTGLVDTGAGARGRLLNCAVMFTCSGRGIPLAGRTTVRAWIAA